MRITHLISVAVLVQFFSYPSFAGDTLPSQFTLGRYIPADTWLYVHGVDNPERRWIDERWAAVARTLVDSGVDQDIKHLIFPMIPAEQRKGLQSHLDQMVDAVKSVRWADLVKHEFVFAERISPGGLSYDYVFLGRGERESAEKNFKALTGILEHVSGFSDKVGIQPYNVDSVSVVALGSRDTASERITRPFVWLIHKDDIVGAAFSPPVDERNRSIMDDVVGMMSGKKPLPAIVDGPRFKEALSHVKSPSDAITYFDLRTMFDNLHQMFDKIGQGISEDKKIEREWISAFAKFLSHADVVDYTISSVDTKGLRTLTDEYTQYRPDKKDNVFARMCSDRKPFEHFEQHIPKNVTSFSMSTGINIEIVYDFTTDFVKKNLPDGEAIIAKLDSSLEQIGFNPKKDFFSWWSGEMVEVSIPASVVTPMGGSSESMIKIRVKDGELALSRVFMAIDSINRKLQQQGQMLIVSPAKCKSGQFREVTHPMLAMIARPVIGVQDDWLILAKSTDIVNKCAAVAAKEAPSILENERFRKEGLIPEGPVVSLSFEDLSGRGDEWGGAAAAVGMFGGMAAGMMPPEVPHEARQLVQSATGIIAKLAPALQQVNFYQSQSSLGVQVGDSAFRKSTLVTYKDQTANKTRESNKLTANPE